MNWLRRGSSEPLWKEEFSVHTADERYVTRRQLTKFLVLTSLGMFVGNIWILVRSIFYKAPDLSAATCCPTRRNSGRRSKAVQLSDKRRPLHHDPDCRERIRRLQPEMHSLSCAVYYSQAENRLECPCHNGFFSIKDGAVLQGPPSRPLPRIVLEARGEQLIAVEVKG